MALEVQGYWWNVGSPVLMQVDGMGYTEAVKILCEQTPVYVSRAEPAPQEEALFPAFPQRQFLPGTEIFEPKGNPG